MRGRKPCGVLLPAHDRSVLEQVARRPCNPSTGKVELRSSMWSISATTQVSRQEGATHQRRLVGQKWTV